MGSPSLITYTFEPLDGTPSWSFTIDVLRADRPSGTGTGVVATAAAGAGNPPASAASAASAGAPTASASASVPAPPAAPGRGGLGAALARAQSSARTASSQAGPGLSPPVPAAPPAAAPDWTRLGYHKCPNCPLDSSVERCPPAVDAAQILERFASTPSTTRLRVTVVTAERTCVKETDAQLGLKALLGLIMASSGCPILGRLRSQALFHLPFASIDETLYRTVGDYLIKQYFTLKEGGQPDFTLSGLDALYRDLAEINMSFFHRIQAASPRDANINAVVTLRSLSDIVSLSLDDRLDSLRDSMRHRPPG